MRGRLRKTSTGKKLSSVSLGSKIDGNILILGERLRLLLHSSDHHLIKDRRHHFRTHSKCFIGKDVIDWLVQYGQAKDRRTGVKLMNVLMRHMVIHHVPDEETDFQDDYSFYRFSIDNNTLPLTREIDPFIKGERVYSKLTVRGCPYKLLKLHIEGGISYEKSFFGSELVAWLMKEEFCSNRQQAVMLGKDLLENDVIRHVTLDHHFKDERLLYQFHPNMDSLKFSDLPDLELPVFSEGEEDRNGSPTALSSPFSRKLSMESPKRSISHPARKLSDTQLTMSSKNSSWPSRTEKSNSLQRNLSNLSSISDENSNIDKDSGSDEGSERCSPVSYRKSSSVVDSLSSVELSESEGNYHKETVKIIADSVGYGFIVRGDGPVFVKAVDPGGPAAAAGLKVSHIITAVNGIDVSNKNHKEVALVILGQPQLLRLDVLSSS
ncbi:DEP domain-containing mTOR-interacting protein [Holothuria leucospilota]|uniref:DEP domain-containing mTOR-interacting protein n=1 Tax=Holothuria leucospilota TaxID=206669 RepID=A0A9Q1BUF4_HOLLE|nr:DEP domain-containing mTOR-interacting protein [Holothuria leucospilota]